MKCKRHPKYKGLKKPIAKCKTCQDIFAERRPDDKIAGRPIRLNQQVLKVKPGKDYAEVLFLGDVHYGSATCNLQKFLAMLDYCLKKGVYVLLMGDMINADLLDSPGGGIYQQRLSPQEQYEDMVKFLRPLADKALLLGLHAGNHEFRVQKTAGVNITKAMAKELGIPYLGAACWSLLKVGKQRYSIYSLHGKTAARFEGTVLLAAERSSVSFNADIFAMGHAHKLCDSHFIRERVVGNRVVQQKQFIVVTGAYLEYHDSYYEAGGGQISKIGSPKAKLFAEKHDVHLSN